MITVVAFTAAAALGALGRAEAGRRWNVHDGLALGTLAVNVAGAFLLGLASGLAPPALTVVGVGGLGAFTTFSSFSRDTVALIEQRRGWLAAVYLAATLVVGIAAAAVGIALSLTR